MSHLAHQKPRLLARVRRLKGQIEAVERAVEADGECAEVLHLLASVRGAINGLTGELIEDHVREHVMNEPDANARAKGGGELIDVIRSYLR
jgi:DNA-binding FrmR family transcriptional regulator